MKFTAVRKIKFLFAAVFVFGLSSRLFADEITIGRSWRLIEGPTAPRLRYPVTEEVIMTGDSPLEFSWWIEQIGIDHFEFRLYKGYDMYAANLIYQEKLAANSSFVKVKPDLFENNQVYSWSLLQVGVDARKSDKSFNSFRVVKK